MIERGSWSALLASVVLFVAADQILHHQIAKERQYLAGQVSGVSGVFWVYSGSHIPGRGLGASGQVLGGFRGYTKQRRARKVQGYQNINFYFT